MVNLEEMLYILNEQGSHDWAFTVFQAELEMKKMKEKEMRSSSTHPDSKL